MNIPIMKYIDEYLGRILCFLLTIFNKKNTSPQSGKIVKNILLIKFWGMGSIILTSPAITTVKKNFPNTKIHFLSFHSNADILKLITGIDEIIPVKLTNPISFFIDTINVIFKLRKTKFDLVFDFEFFTYYSAIITRLIKAKYSVGFDNHKNKRSLLFSETVLFNDHIHTRGNFINLALSVCKNETKNIYLKILPEDELKTGSMPFIVVNPNASKMAYERRLPADHFVKLIEELSATGKFNIVLTGSEDEKEYVDAIINNLKNRSLVKGLAGKLTVSGLTNLINSSLCLITNDSGPLHIASALNKPVIAFFGPESPVRYGPLSDKKLVFYRALECSPCMSISNSKTVNCIYPEPRCMTGFDINEIIVKTKKFVNSLRV